MDIVQPCSYVAKPVLLLHTSSNITTISNAPTMGPIINQTFKGAAGGGGVGVGVGVAVGAGAGVPMMADKGKWAPHARTLLSRLLEVAVIRRTLLPQRTVMAWHHQSSG